MLSLYVYSKISIDLIVPKVIVYCVAATIAFGPNQMGWWHRRNVWLKQLLIKSEQLQIVKLDGWLETETEPTDDDDN